MAQVTAENANLQVGEWHHVAFTLDMENKKVLLWVNNMNVASTVVDESSIPIFNPSTNVKLGSDGTSQFEGLMDNIVIYEKNVSDEELKQIMNYRDPELYLKKALESYITFDKFRTNLDAEGVVIDAAVVSEGERVNDFSNKSVRISAPSSAPIVKTNSEMKTDSMSVGSWIKPVSVTERDMEVFGKEGVFSLGVKQGGEMTFELGNEDISTKQFVVHKDTRETMTPNRGSLSFPETAAARAEATLASGSYFASEFTMSMWFKVDSFATTRTLMSGMGFSTESSNKGLCVENGSLYMYDAANTLIVQVGNIVADQWYHLVLTDESLLLNYRKYEYTKSPIWTNDKVLKLGNNYSNNKNFLGHIDEFVLYMKRLDPLAIYELFKGTYPSKFESLVVVKYEFDDSGTPGKDSGSAGINLTLTSATHSTTVLPFESKTLYAPMRGPDGIIKTHYDFVDDVVDSSGNQNDALNEQNITFVNSFNNVSYRAAEFDGATSKINCPPQTLSDMDDGFTATTWVQLPEVLTPNTRYPIFAQEGVMMAWLQTDASLNLSTKVYISPKTDFMIKEAVWNTDSVDVIMSIKSVSADRIYYAALMLKKLDLSVAEDVQALNNAFVQMGVAPQSNTTTEFTFSLTEATGIDGTNYPVSMIDNAYLYMRVVGDVYDLSSAKNVTVYQNEVPMFDSSVYNFVYTTTGPLHNFEALTMTNSSVTYLTDTVFSDEKTVAEYTGKSTHNVTFTPQNDFVLDVVFKQTRAGTTDRHSVLELVTSAGKAILYVAHADYWRFNYLPDSGTNAATEIYAQGSSSGMQPAFDDWGRHTYVFRKQTGQVEFYYNGVKGNVVAENSQVTIVDGTTNVFTMDGFNPFDAENTLKIGYGNQGDQTEGTRIASMDVILDDQAFPEFATPAEVKDQTYTPTYTLSFASGTEANSFPTKSGSAQVFEIVPPTPPPFFETATRSLDMSFEEYAIDNVDIGSTGVTLNGTTYASSGVGKVQTDENGFNYLEMGTSGKVTLPAYTDTASSINHTFYFVVRAADATTGRIQRMTGSSGNNFNIHILSNSNTGMVPLQYPVSTTFNPKDSYMFVVLKAKYVSPTVYDMRIQFVAQPDGVYSTVGSDTEVKNVTAMYDYDVGTIFTIGSQHAEANNFKFYECGIIDKYVSDAEFDAIVDGLKAKYYAPSMTQSFTGETKALVKQLAYNPVDETQVVYWQTTPTENAVEDMYAVLLHPDLAITESFPTGVISDQNSGNASKTATDVGAVFDFTPVSGNALSKMGSTILNNGDTVYGNSVGWRTGTGQIVFNIGKLFDGTTPNEGDFLLPNGERMTDMPGYARLEIFIFYYEPSETKTVNSFSATIYRWYGGNEMIKELGVYDNGTLTPISLERYVYTGAQDTLETGTVTFDPVSIGPGKPLKIVLGQTNDTIRFSEMKLENTYAGIDASAPVGDGSITRGDYELHQFVLSNPTNAAVQRYNTTVSTGTTYTQFSAFTHALTNMDGTTAPVEADTKYVAKAIVFDSSFAPVTNELGYGPTDLNTYVHLIPVEDSGEIKYMTILNNNATDTTLTTFSQVVTDASGTPSSQHLAKYFNGMLYAEPNNSKLLNCEALNLLLAGGAENTRADRSATFFMVIANVTAYGADRCLIGHGEGYYQNHRDRSIRYSYVDGKITYKYYRVSNDASPIESSPMDYDSTKSFVYSFTIDDNTATGEGYTLKMFHNNVECFSYVETNGYIFRFTDSARDLITNVSVFNHTIHLYGVGAGASFYAGDIMGYSRVLSEEDHGKVLNILLGKYESTWLQVPSGIIVASLAPNPQELLFHMASTKAVIFYDINSPNSYTVDANNNVSQLINLSASASGQYDAVMNTAAANTNIIVSDSKYGSHLLTQWSYNVTYDHTNFQDGDQFFVFHFDTANNRNNNALSIDGMNPAGVLPNYWQGVGHGSTSIYIGNAGHVSNSTYQYYNGMVLLHIRMKDNELYFRTVNKLDSDDSFNNFVRDFVAQSSPNTTNKTEFGLYGYQNESHRSTFKNKVYEFMYFEKDQLTDAERDDLYNLLMNKYMATDEDVVGSMPSEYNLVGKYTGTDAHTLSFTPPYDYLVDLTVNADTAQKVMDLQYGAETVSLNAADPWTLSGSFGEVSLEPFVDTWQSIRFEGEPDTVNFPNHNDATKIHTGTFFKNQYNTGAYGESETKNDYTITPNDGHFRGAFEYLVFESPQIGDQFRFAVQLDTIQAMEGDYAPFSFENHWSFDRLPQAPNYGYLPGSTTTEITDGTGLVSMGFYRRIKPTGQGSLETGATWGESSTGYVHYEFTLIPHANGDTTKFSFSLRVHDGEGIDLANFEDISVYETTSAYPFGSINSSQGFTIAEPLIFRDCMYFTNDNRRVVGVATKTSLAATPQETAAEHLVSPVNINADDQSIADFIYRESEHYTAQIANGNGPARFLLNQTFGDSGGVYHSVTNAQSGTWIVFDLGSELPLTRMRMWHYVWGSKHYPESMPKDFKIKMFATTTEIDAALTDNGAATQADGFIWDYVYSTNTPTKHTFVMDGQVLDMAPNTFGNITNDPYIVYNDELTGKTSETNGYHEFDLSGYGLQGRYMVLRFMRHGTPSMYLQELRLFSDESASIALNTMNRFTLVARAATDSMEVYHDGLPAIVTKVSGSTTVTGNSFTLGSDPTAQEVTLVIGGEENGQLLVESCDVVQSTQIITTFADPTYVAEKQWALTYTQQIAVDNVTPADTVLGWGKFDNYLKSDGTKLETGIEVEMWKDYFSVPIENVWGTDTWMIIKTIDGKYYGVGFNQYGQMGMPYTEMTSMTDAANVAENYYFKVPVELPHFAGYDIKKMILRRNSTMFLTTEGKLYGMGKGEATHYCHFGTGTNSTQLNTVTHLATDKVIKDFHQSGANTIILTTDNKLFTVGNNNDHGALGNGNLTSTNTFGEVATNITSTETIKQVYTTDGHSASGFFTESGRAFGCGWGYANQYHNGQIHPATNTSFVELKFPDGRKIKQFFMTPIRTWMVDESNDIYVGGAHYENTNGWPSGVFGPGGYTNGPTLIDASINDGTEVIDILHQSTTGIVVVRAGGVYSFGKNDDGRLGNGDAVTTTTTRAYKIADQHPIISFITTGLGPYLLIGYRTMAAIAPTLTDMDKITDVNTIGMDYGVVQITNTNPFVSMDSFSALDNLVNITGAVYSEHANIEKYYVAIFDVDSSIDNTISTQDLIALIESADLPANAKHIGGPLSRYSPNAVNIDLTHVYSATGTSIPIVADMMVHAYMIAVDEGGRFTRQFRLTGRKNMLVLGNTQEEILAETTFVKENGQVNTWDEMSSRFTITSHITMKISEDGIYFHNHPIFMQGNWTVIYWAYTGPNAQASGMVTEHPTAPAEVDWPLGRSIDEPYKYNTVELSKYDSQDGNNQSWEGFGVYSGDGTFQSDGWSGRYESSPVRYTSWIQVGMVHDAVAKTMTAYHIRSPGNYTTYALSDVTFTATEGYLRLWRKYIHNNGTCQVVGVRILNNEVLTPEQISQDTRTTSQFSTVV